MLPNHYEECVTVSAPPQQVFTFIDDHKSFSSHMNNSSWMMMGGKMETQVDTNKGQKVGSHITMSGSVLGIPLYLDEVVVEYNPYRKKVWKTVGSPSLIIIGNYQMSVELLPYNGQSRLRVSIDYEMPQGIKKLLGYLLAKPYAKWCVRQMVSGVKSKFS
jgi:carbon monoxide dehydrogenase subunit G